MKIKIGAGNEYTIIGQDAPIEGRIYNLEDAETGSEAQNKAFHALIQEYFKSGASSYEATNLADFKNCIKRNLGAGFEAFVYAIVVDGKAIIRDAKTYTEIPEEVRADPNLKSYVRGRLKSWTDYTKKERRETMDRLISEMHQSGVMSKKFMEIIEGMEGLWKKN
jgi:hypothetical protein